MEAQHKNLAAGGWQKMSFREQMGNIGGEINRALYWRGKDGKLRDDSLIRAFELLDLTIADSRWRLHLKELTRVREVLSDATLGGGEYGSTLEDLDRYFFHFAFAARINRQ